MTEFPEIKRGSLCGYDKCEHDCCKKHKEQILSRSALEKKIAESLMQHKCPIVEIDCVRQGKCKICDVINELLWVSEADEKEGGGE